MAFDLYLGNLSLEVTEDDIKPLFEPYCRAISIMIPRDEMLQNSKGYAFVELDSKEACEKAMRELDGIQLKGRALILSLVKDRLDYDTNNGTPTKGFWRV